MKKYNHILFSGILLINAISLAEAALVSTATLYFDTPVYNQDGLVTSGSNFGIDTNGNSIIELSERVGLTSNDGLKLGVAQPASVASPGIDQPWMTFGQQGISYTTSPVTILSDDGQGNVELDFSGWSVNWNNIDFDFGGGAWGSNPEGVAQMTCSNDCSNGDSFSIFYTATLNEGGFQGLKYRLGFDSNAIPLAALSIGDTGPSEDLGVIATGTISAVPVPAAVWLFGSGLIGLAGFARRNKT